MNKASTNTKQDNEYPLEPEAEYSFNLSIVLASSHHSFIQSVK